jgi:coenzyme F420-0:L-glutamate ligase/coenzyme F420-1:gamma-L-glutamate ligase
MGNRFTVEALEGIPLIAEGDNLAKIIIDALAATNLALANGDILVLAQKIVSKAEGRTASLGLIEASPRAREISAITGKDSRLVELILSESRTIIRQAPGVLITEHRNGYIMANAGIDASNVAPDTGQEKVLLLPLNPDESCAALRAELQQHFGTAIGVIISDSFGRPWRHGTTGVALGAAGLPSLWDRRGETDLFGRVLKVSQQAVADELAATASLLQGQGAEGRPVVLVRGLDFSKLADRPANDLLRPASQDLFR